MKKKIRNLLFVLASAQIATVSFAQEKKVDEHNEVWVQYFNNVKLSKSYSVNADVGYRWTEGITDKLLYLGRAGITRKLTKTLSFSGGFTYFHYHGNPHFSKLPRNEYRPWQQLAFLHSLKKVQIQNRLRTEQRWFKVKGRDEWHFNHRFRYQLSFQYLLKGTQMGKGVPYLQLNNEIMFNAGKEIKYNHFDQNRVLVGVGYGLTSHTQALLAYQNSWQKRNSSDAFYNLHTLRISFFHNLDLSSTQKQE